MMRGSSPPSSAVASHQIAASGSLPRMLLISADVTPDWSYGRLRSCAARSTSFGVTALPAGVMRTARSSSVNMRRASPAANPINCRRASSSTETLPPNPRASSSARWSSVVRSSWVSGARRKVRMRERSAGEIARGGGSVVAPTKMIVPDSTCGSSASCCVRLNRWSSSIKRSVCSPCARRSAAAATALRTSATPSLVAERLVGTARTAAAMTAASVDLPEPGGPQRSSDGVSPRSRRRRSGAPGPMSASCPTTSSIVAGRIRAASGAAGASAPRSVASLLIP